MMIPTSVTQIVFNPFERCASLISIDVASGNPVFESVDGVLFDKSQKMLVSYPCGKKGAYTIPEGILLIGDYAFFNCEGLTNVTIPRGVTKIGDGAFRSCHALTDMTIPDSVTEIGILAFQDCGALTGAEIPYSVTRIGDEAFSECSVELMLKVAEDSEGEDFAKRYKMRYVTVKNRSLENYKEAVEINERGKIHREKGQYDLALADFTEAIALANYPEAYSNRGIVYGMQGQYNLAISDFTEALAIGKYLDFAAIYHNRGVSYYYLELYDLAVADYTKAIELAPGYIRAYRSRADVYEAMGDMAAAITDRQKADELSGLQ